MHTEIRVTEYRLSIKNVLKDHYPSFIRVPGFRCDVEKYAFRDNDGLSIISQSKGPIRNEYYNVILSCHNDDKKSAEKQIENFAEKTLLDLREAPPFLKNHFKIFDAMFSSMKDMPEYKKLF